MRRILLGVILGALLAWLAVRGIDWGVTRGVLSGLSWQFVLLALLSLILGGYIKAIRWRLLFVTERVSIARLFIVHNAGTGINNILPVRVLNEVLSFGLLTLRDKLDAGVVIATIVADRAMDLITTLTIFLLGMLLLPRAGVIGNALKSGSILLLLVVIAFFVLFPRLANMPLLQRVRVMRSFYTALDSLGQRKGRLVLVFIASLLFWLLLGLSGWFLALGLGLEVPFMAVVVTIVATTFLTSAVPSLPGAVGTFEFGVVYFLGLLSSTIVKEAALAFALVTHLVLFIPPILIAAYVIVREGEAFGKARRSFLNWMGKQNLEQDRD